MDTLQLLTISLMLGVALFAVIFYDRESKKDSYVPLVWTFIPMKKPLLSVIHRLGWLSAIVVFNILVVSMGNNLIIGAIILSVGWAFLFEVTGWIMHAILWFFTHLKTVFNKVTEWFLGNNY